MTQTEWMLQVSPGGPADPVLMALGVKQNGITPSITFEALETNDATFKEYFAPRLQGYHELDDPEGDFHILSENCCRYSDNISSELALEIVCSFSNFNS